MHGSSSSKDALLPLLARLYEEIRAIEIEQELWAGPDDYRPRIERFHDAIRAYTSGISPYDANSRLSIEALAADMEGLRAIQANPLAKLPGGKRLAPGTRVAVRKPASVGQTRPSGRAVRSELAERYKQYAVMFAALLAESADMNHQSRMEEQDATVTDLAQLQQAIKGKKRVNLQKEAQAILDELGIVQQLPRGQVDPATADKAIKALLAQADAVQAGLEQAHLTWLSGQLALYQDGKEVVKKLQQHGLQMAGRFLQEAMARGGAGTSRGF